MAPEDLFPLVLWFGDTTGPDLQRDNHGTGKFLENLRTIENPSIPLNSKLEATGEITRWEDEHNMKSLGLGEEASTRIADKLHENNDYASPFAPDATKVDIKDFIDTAEKHFALMPSLDGDGDIDEISNYCNNRMKLTFYGISLYLSTGVFGSKDEIDLATRMNELFSKTMSKSASAKVALLPRMQSKVLTDFWT